MGQYTPFPLRSSTKSNYRRLGQEIRRAVGANLVFALLLPPLLQGDHKDRPYISVPMSYGSI